MIGNFVLGAGCSWGDNCLQVPAGAFALSENPLTPATDGSYSVSVCFKLNTLSNSAPIICQAAKYTTLDANDRFCLYMNGTNIQLYIKTRGNNTSTSYRKGIAANNILVAGNKYVVDIVVDGANRVVYMYVNGLLVGSATGYNYTAWDCTLPVGLNCLSKTTSANASMDYYAINIYDRALTAEEVETNFRAYNSRFNLGL